MAKGKLDAVSAGLRLSRPRRYLRRGTPLSYRPPVCSPTTHQMKSLPGAPQPLLRLWRRLRRPDPPRPLSGAVGSSRADPFQTWRDPADHEFESVFLAARDGQGWALSELYRALFPRILQYLGAVEPVEAEDVACDTWLDV